MLADPALFEFHTGMRESSLYFWQNYFDWQRRLEKQKHWQFALKLDCKNTEHKLCMHLHSCKKTTGHSTWLSYSTSGILKMSQCFAFHLPQFSALGNSPVLSKDTNQRIFQRFRCTLTAFSFRRNSMNWKTNYKHCWKRKCSYRLNGIWKEVWYLG